MVAMVLSPLFRLPLALSITLAFVKRVNCDYLYEVEQIFIVVVFLQLSQGGVFAGDYHRNQRADVFGFNGFIMLVADLAAVADCD